uniref:N-acetyltransferase domain-containing protein n=1 Tax=Amphimedon queenslandica TaxID=400682 RepID=A0A1X7TI66_AMPQE
MSIQNQIRLDSLIILTLLQYYPVPTEGAHSWTCSRLLSSQNGNGSVLGFIKTGRKRLFLTDNRTLLHEVEPLCIMDFYVHETQQRRGHGKELFENVLQEEGLSAFEVAIDRLHQSF